jgi:hypothetical protein
MNAENPVQIHLFGVSATGTKGHEAGRAYRRLWRRACQFNGSVALPVVAGCDCVTTLDMIDVISLVGIVFAGLSALVIEDVEDEGSSVVVRARTRGAAVPCPGCGAESSRVHGYYERTAARPGRRPARRAEAAGPPDALPRAGLRGADVPRAGRRRAGALPAAHHAAGRASRGRRPGISGPCRGPAAGGVRDRRLPAHGPAGHLRSTGSTG